MSPTLVNLVHDHGFIVKKYISIGTRLFGEAQSKAMRGYVQSGQYHTIVESRDSNSLALHRPILTEHRSNKQEHSDIASKILVSRFHKLQVHKTMFKNVRTWLAT